MSRFSVVLLIHAHQPVGNFDDVIERAYQSSYLPFVQLLSQHPLIRVGLHFSGGLLEWIEAKHPEYFADLNKLVARGQVEMIGGGFYEPILIAVPAEDAREQLERLAAYLAQHFGKRPRGAWLAERVWEPQLPSLLASAGVKYTLVDDNHFLSAGFDPGQLFGSFIAEDQGHSVQLIPGLKALRYLIPYRDPEEVIGFFRQAASERPGGFAAMGDDMEKFGVWPGTHDHCYKNGWLVRFFNALEANHDWLATVPPGEALSAHEPIGRADLPTCSYAEMMEWALPTSARLRYQAVEREFASRPDVSAFLRGGFWRGFLTKYAEANLMQKKVILASRKLKQAEAKLGAAAKSSIQLQDAKTDLLRAQANDAYWHGVFGGLYAPHLRTAVWQPLVRSETFADAAARPSGDFAELEHFDLDCDGRDEFYITTNRAAVLISPADGATVEAIDFRPRGVTLINSMMRRPEAYHTRLAQASAASGRVESIHDQVRVKEPGLEKKLKYDRWPRHSFRTMLFPPQRSQEDYENLRLGEDAGLAGGAYHVKAATAAKLALEAATSDGQWKAEKSFSFSATPEGFSIACDLALRYAGKMPVTMDVGIESVLNLLAADEPNRYIAAANRRYPLRHSGVVPGPQLCFVDEWQKVEVQLLAEGASAFWLAPIETISDSEEGFERVFQGTQALAVWPVEFQPGALWRGRLVLTVSPRR
ncbi:MAG TPA: alpha-amylase/4-alpha-glucanotransferase domain-containing protein [Candidatus Acidoferrales bacterium]|nr:alpha-amylase/4-alpha-glucanotransferase domain-containing protein [Candidatus Acidoferrales bacterium]